MNKIPRVTLRSQQERVVVKTVYVDIYPQNMPRGCKGILRSLKTVVVSPYKLFSFSRITSMSLYQLSPKTHPHYAVVHISDSQSSFNPHPFLLCYFSSKEFICYIHGQVKGKAKFPVKHSVNASSYLCFRKPTRVDCHAHL